MSKSPLVTVGQCPECGSPMIEERRVVNATLGRRSDCKVSFMGVVRACVVCDEVDTGFNLEFGPGAKRPLKGFEVEAARVAQERAEEAEKQAKKDAREAKKQGRKRKPAGARRAEKMKARKVKANKKRAKKRAAKPPQDEQGVAA